MWETIKNDPILKTVTIIILSVLGFGFAFNIMFGSNTGGMEHGGMGGGSSLENTLAYILVLAFKLLLIAVVVAAIIAVVKFAKKNISSEGGEIKIFDSIKKDPVLKGIAVVVLLSVALALVYYLFSSLLGFGSRQVMMNGYMGYGLGISGLLIGLFKFLLIASIAGLIIGFVMYIKQNYGKELADKLSTVKINTGSTEKCPHCNTNVSNQFKFCPQCGKSMKEQCLSCSAELQPEWKCCPTCGRTKGETQQ